MRRCSPARFETAAIVYTALIATAVLTAIVAARAQPKDVREELGVSGYVLTPDGVPVSGGTVTVRSQGAEADTPVSQAGRFRIVPHVPGASEMRVSVPGFAVHRVTVGVPPSKTLTLPPIRLPRPSYFRVRLVSPAGEPITAPRILSQSLDVSGVPIGEPPGGRVPLEVDPDGTTTIGPLPRGITTLMLDTPPFARTRLPDVRITGEPLVDAGTVRVEPGGTLHVEVVDETGAPIAGHGVSLEDAVPFSPAMIPAQRTDPEGRVTFDRLASRRYRVRTATVGMCGNPRLRLTISRSISASGTGTIQTRLIVGGTVTLRFTTAGVPLRAAQVALTPEAMPPAPPPWLRAPFMSPQFVGRPFRLFGESSCLGATDSAGRVRFTSFPPGPARADVRLPNSTWVRRLNVPAQARDVELEIPAGFMPLSIVNAHTRAAIPAAAITWTSSGGRIEATTSVSGEALLDGVADAPGTLAVRLQGYRPRELKLPTPPDVLHEVALEPTRDGPLQCRVVSESGKPLANAVVELTPADPLELAHIATTDEKGLVRFFPVPAGSLRLLGWANGYAASRMVVPANATSEVTLTLSRGYRILARVESPVGAGPHLFRILNNAGIVLDDVLDAASDRALDPPGSVSLGPLPPDTYIIELRGGRQQRQERIRVQNRDVHVTFR